MVKKKLYLIHMLNMMIYLNNMKDNMIYYNLLNKIYFKTQNI